MDSYSSWTPKFLLQAPIPSALPNPLEMRTLKT
jgi:hypothetical protein